MLLPLSSLAEKGGKGSGELSGLGPQGSAQTPLHLARIKPVTSARSHPPSQEVRQA